MRKHVAVPPPRSAPNPPPGPRGASPTERILPELATITDPDYERARLAALDSTALHLADSPLFRYPTLRREAQSTSALEGTYAPLTAFQIAAKVSPGRAKK